MRNNCLLIGALLTTLGGHSPAAAAQATAATTQAPATAAPPAAAPQPAQAQPAADGGQLLLTAGRSMVLTVPFEISRIAITACLQPRKTPSR